MNLYNRGTHKKRIRVILTILLLMVGAVLITQTAFAEDNIYTGTIPSTEVIENDIIITGSNVVIDGTIKGDIFFSAGRTITINGEVEGSVVAVGEKVTINGQVGGSVYTAAAHVEVGPEATIGRSLYFLSLRVSVAKGSVITQDLVGLALGAELGSNPGRDQRVVFGLFELVLRILNRYDVETGNLALLPEPVDIVQMGPVPAGQLVLASGGPGGSGTIVSDNGEEIPVLYLQEAEKQSQGAAFADWSISRIQELVTFLVIAGLTAWWFPSAFSRWAFYLRARPWASVGFGIVAWATGFAGLGILSALIIAIFIGLFVITLGSLAVVFFGVTAPSLWLAFSIFLIFVLYMSKGIVAYRVGAVILERLAPRAAARKFWPLLLGLVLYVLLRSIPYFGWALSVVVTLLGLGAVWLTYTSRFREPIYLDSASAEEE